jgi:two-component system response regulator CpxR
MATETLLLIDDDVELCALLEEFLIDEGFGLKTCHNGLEGVAEANSGSYSLVILDVMLPGCNGFEALQKIRKQSDVPVLMLTARGDEVDRIVGLRVGDLEMDMVARRVFRLGEEIELTAVEFTLLKTLVLSAGEVVGREDLNRAVLGRDYSPEDRSIDVHVSKLRKKLGSPAKGKGDLIKAIRGEGYLYAASEVVANGMGETADHSKTGADTGGTAGSF